MEKLLIPRIKAANLLSISVDTLDSLRNADAIRCVRIGSRVFYTPEELRSFIAKENAGC